MVAEEHGKIGFYDIRSHTAVTSLEVPGPLGSAHWAPSELNLVAATAGHEVFFWNIAKSRYACFQYKYSQKRVYSKRTRN